MVRSVAPTRLEPWAKVQAVIASAARPSRRRAFARLLRMRWMESYQRDLRHVLVEGGPPRDRRIPALDVVELRPLRHEVAIAPHHDAGRDVAVGKCVARQKPGLAELVVEHLDRVGGLALAGRDRRVVAFFGPRAHTAPEARPDRP